jgi:Na+-transporting methylmalonyl-CoA/oxaloacetate decarboxylase gamma subunit
MANLIENIRTLDWGYILGTLVIRFVGVFVVLFILMVGMMILGKVVSALVANQEAGNAEDDEKDPHAIELAEEPEREVGEEEIVAAIGAALAMSMERRLSGASARALGRSRAARLRWMPACRAVPSGAANSAVARILLRKTSPPHFPPGVRSTPCSFLPIRELLALSSA